MFNLQHFKTLYDDITSAISGQYEGIFKSKAEARPFAESQEAKPPLERVQIEEVFLKFTHGNGSESGYVKGLDKEIPMYALQRKPSNNDSLNQEERKTAFRTEWLLPSKIQTSPDIISTSKLLPLKSILEKEIKFPSRPILPSKPPGGAEIFEILPSEPPEGQEISLSNSFWVGIDYRTEKSEEEVANTKPGDGKVYAKPYMRQDSIPKAQPDKPSAFDKFVDGVTRIMDFQGTVLLTPDFWNWSTREEQKKDTPIDSNFMVGKEPAPFLIPLGQARSVPLPPLSPIQEEGFVPLSSIQEEDKLHREVLQKNIEKITQGIKKSIISKLNEIDVNEYQEEVAKQYLSGLAQVNPIRIEICKQIFKEKFGKELKIPNNYEAVISPAINSDSSDIDKAFDKLNLIREELLKLHSAHSGVKDDRVKKNQRSEVSKDLASLSSLQKEQESYLTKSNEKNEIKADISLVTSKEGKEDPSTLQVPLDEHDGPQRREREQLGIDTPPSRSRRPVDEPRYKRYRGAKSLMVGSRNQASGNESGLASANQR